MTIIQAAPKNTNYLEETKTRKQNLHTIHVFDKYSFWWRRRSLAPAFTFSELLVLIPKHLPPQWPSPESILFFFFSPKLGSNRKTCNPFLKSKNFKISRIFLKFFEKYKCICIQIPEYCLFSSRVPDMFLMSSHA